MLRKKRPDIIPTATSLSCQGVPAKSLILNAFQDAVVMNYLVDTWSDFLSAGKLMITFHPYADIPSSPVTKTTVKDAKDFISTTYAGLPELPAGKDPSQYA